MTDLEDKRLIMEEIQAEHERVLDRLAQNPDDESCIDDFQEFEAEKIAEYFDVWAQRFQRAYAVFETQMAKFGKGRHFDYDHYTKIGAMNTVVNVLKHGTDGSSYQDLINKYPKFLDTPTEFMSILPDQPVSDVFARYMMGLVASQTASEILNLEHSDLMDFFEEAKIAWSDMSKGVAVTPPAKSGKATTTAPTTTTPTSKTSPKTK